MTQFAKFVRRTYRSLTLCVAVLTATSLNGQPAENRDAIRVAELAPGTEFESEIKSPEQFFGFALGSRHLRHDQLTAYARYLSRTSDRVRVLPYGKTHGSRPLMVLMVTRDAESVDLSLVQKQRRRLTSGLASGDDLSEAKTVSYFGYCVHGDEASAANAFPAVAYYLAAGQSDEIDRLLGQSILLLDPALNPDGADRFANWVNENRGRFPNSNAIDREHNQPWPGGRTNYYWFDLNRDWLPAVHPESQGRLGLFHRFKPNLVLDFHEMGSTSSYFFQPGIPARNNPLTPKRVFELTREFAKEHAAALDEADELYFSEERFDDFYVGKGSTYPDLHGAIGILFEQGSTRGLHSLNERYDRTFAETVANQIRTSLSSLRMLDRLRLPLIKHQTTFYRDALALAKASPVRAYVLHGDRSRLREAVSLMRRHDIVAEIPETDIQIEGKKLAAGTAAIIPVEQPEYRFIQSLMMRMQSFRENIFYDVSAWTTPLAFDLDVIEFNSDLPGAWMDSASPVSPSSASDQGRADTESIIGYSIDPVSLDATRLVGRLLGKGAQVRVAYDGFDIGVGSGSKTPIRRGSWLVLKSVNQSKWETYAADLEMEIATSSTLSITPLERGLTPGGPDLGSNDHRVIPKPEILLVVGEGTSGLDAGSIWHTLDTRWEIPATLLNAEEMSSVDLKPFSCVVLPSGSYRAWNASVQEKLQRYVSSGGTVVAIGSAISRLKAAKLVAPTSSNDATLERNPSPRQTFAGASDRAALERIAGAFFSSRVDTTHPLGFGFPDGDVPVFRTSTAAYGLPQNPLGAAAIYDSVSAGYVSASNRKRLKGTAAVWAENVGEGRVICLADSPTFRGYVRGTERFLSNAILLGPVLRIPADTPRAADDDGHGHHHH